MPPLTADRSETENAPENRATAECNHPTRPETEREQEDKDIIESDVTSDLFIQEPSRDTGWTPGGDTGDLGSFGNHATPTTTSSETSVSSISSSLTTGSSLLSPSDESAVVVADPMSNVFDTNDCATGSFCSSCSIPPRVAGGLWREGVGCDACCFPMGIARLRWSK